MAHIPHQGRMCLLDEVTHWDAEHVSCRSSNQGDPDNPLRAHGRLGIVCGIEYAAQAMAVHGALTAAALPGAGATAGMASAGAAAGTAKIAGTATSTTLAVAAAAAGFITPTTTMPPATVASPGSTPQLKPPLAGFLAALRGVAAHVSRLDDVPGNLIVTAARIAGDHASALYEFEVRSAIGCLLSGRATVVLDANGRLRA